MNKSITIALAALMLAFTFSCKKTTTAPSATGVPWGMIDTLMPTTNTEFPFNTWINANGVMVACNLSGNLIDTAGANHLYNRNWEAAIFAGSATDFIGGVTAVTVNSTPLSVGPQRMLSHNDTAVIWNTGTLNHWSVTGFPGIPSLAADVAGTMPAFTGTLPASLSTTTGFSFTFNSGNTTNADSAYAVIYTGGAYRYSNVVSATGGTIVISASVMGNFRNNYLLVDGVTPYYGGLIMFVIYNHTIQTIGGKQFAFVKQKEVMGVVNFL